MKFQPRLDAVCIHCGKPFGEHRNADDACPTREWFSNTNKFSEEPIRGTGDKGICSVCRRPQPNGYHQHPCE